MVKLAASGIKPGHSEPAFLPDKHGLHLKPASFLDGPVVQFSTVPTWKRRVA